MCSVSPVSSVVHFQIGQDILHPKVCCAGLGLLVSATTEPFRVGVSVVADMLLRRGGEDRVLLRVKCVNYMLLLGREEGCNSRRIDWANDDVHARIGLGPRS